MKKYTLRDCFIIAEIVLIGLAEAAHLAGVFLGWSFSRCTVLFGGLAGAGLLGGIGCVLFRKHRSERGLDKGAEAKRSSVTESILYLIFAAAVLSQLIFICMGNTVYRDKDMTVETVGSFLVSDGIYRVNPMTGFPYQAGLPSRLKILCLPALYGMICRATGLEPGAVVRLIIPVVTLFSCYIAFSALGGSLFPGDRKRQACFLIVVSLLLWTGTYGYGMDGFGVLFCGWRGVVIRNGVLVPWALSLCIRKKWFSALLCVLAEACIVWTLYGFGVCAAVTAGMAAAGLCCKVFSGKENAG